jgi:hypothetical protein
MPFEEVGPIVGRSAEATRQLASRARRRVRGGGTPDPDLVRQREVVVLDRLTPAERLTFVLHDMLPRTPVAAGSGASGVNGSSRRDWRDRSMSRHTRATTVVSHPPRLLMPAVSARLSRSHAS